MLRSVHWTMCLCVCVLMCECVCSSAQRQTDILQSLVALSTALDLQGQILVILEAHLAHQGALGAGQRLFLLVVVAQLRSQAGHGGLDAVQPVVRRGP